MPSDCHVQQKIVLHVCEPQVLYIIPWRFSILWSKYVKVLPFINRLSSLLLEIHISLLKGIVITIIYFLIHFQPDVFADLDYATSGRVV
jgi:hypothetical protein